MEHRWGERVAVRVPVELFGGSCPAIHGSLENLSASGAFIRTPGNVPPRGPIQVRLSTEPAPSRRHPARVAAYIVRETEDGVGVEWRQFAPLPVRELMKHGGRIRRPARHPSRAARRPLAQPAVATSANTLPVIAPAVTGCVRPRA